MLQQSNMTHCLLWQAQEFWCTILSGLFNAAGCLFMILPIAGISIHSFFLGYAIYGAGATFVVFLIYPPVPYKQGDTFRLLAKSRKDDQEDKPTRQLSQPHIFGSHSTSFEIQTLSMNLHKPRFGWYCFAFSSVSLIGVMVGGLSPSILPEMSV